MEQEKEVKKEQKQKKSNKLSGLLMIVLVVGACVCYFFYMKGMVKPVVAIGGTEVTVDMTVQELINAGFSVGDSISGSGDMNLATQPQIPGESYTSTFYYVYAKDSNGRNEYANVVYHVYNKNVNSVDFKDSQIYAYRYDPSFTFSKASVLVNGIDFVGLGAEDAITKLEELGIKFDKKDKEELLSGERHIIFGDSGDYSYVIETDISDGHVTNVEAKLNV